MKLSAIISFALLFAVTMMSYGQVPVRQTVVLNDGTRIRGTIVGDSAELLMVKVTRPAVITLNKSSVFSYDAELTKRPATGYNPGYSMNRHGYFIRVTTSVLAGKNDNGSTGSLSFHFSNGYQFRNGLSAGIGFGLEELEVVVMPVYVDLRYYPLKSGVSPFVYVKSGYGFSLNDAGSRSLYPYAYYTEGKGGFVFNPGAGIALYSTRGNSVNMGVGYRYQKLSFAQSDIWGRPTTSELISRFNRIELQFGFTFM